MTDIDLLESVLAKDERLIAGVRPEQRNAPTACPEYDVAALQNHIVGWIQAIAAGINGRDVEGDPGAYTTDDPEGDFRKAAADLVAGWRARGLEGKARFVSTEMPAPVVFGMTLMEYVTHGIDLARATGQEVPFTDEEVGTTLERATGMLPDEYRGEGQPFGQVVPVPDDAPVVDRLLAFTGRRP